MRWTFRFKKFELGLDESQILTPSTIAPGTHVLDVLSGKAGTPWLLYKTAFGDFAYINTSLCYQIIEHN